jgi:hypothetical protein
MKTKGIIGIMREAKKIVSKILAIFTYTRTPVRFKYSREFS